MNNQNTTDSNFSLLNDVGENYHYAKTIINNKVEILKLEMLQQISNLGNILAIAFLALFLAMIVITLLVAATVVYMAQIMDSYFYAILITIGITTLTSGILFVILKPRIINGIEKRLIRMASK